MKKILSLLLLFSLIFNFSCQAGETENGSESGKLSKVKTTFMIYMLGSDLEAKGGAATKDLDEILASGINTEENNVVVFTGGSKKWHNDIATDEEHSILQLKNKEFVRLKTLPNASMGDSENLSTFLNYAYNNFPAEEYALVMWDHGNGPVIGYGKDMLFDNDSLTLKEMKTAFEASPFVGENKLAWIGFDACLMASAELACVLDTHAKYLVASQEIEPSFGWNYSFLGSLSRVSTPDLTKKITDDYLKTCEEYYLKKGYTDRDTTLSCIDLSLAGDLEISLEKLFETVESSVDNAYSVLTAKRVETRALGRASTGSEYDLIDVYDLAEQLSDMYPEEASNLKKVINNMTIANATNTERCCGMSLYFPFYNKTYYEQDWRTTYNDLGIFPKYLNFLSSYSQKWLGNDFLTNVAESRVPSAVSDGKYKLELSDAQEENFAEAKYYILTKEGEGLYNPIFSSSNVTKNGNSLTASFDGSIIYFKNNFGEYFIPVSYEFDTIGDITRYGVYTNAVNAYANPLYNDYERIVDGYMFHLAADNASKKIALSALTPWDTKVTAGSIMGGKTEEPDLSIYSKFVFPQGDHLYLKRYENGTICPLSEWQASSYMSQYHAPLGDGYEFVFAPLAAGEYVLVFEITDTQGNKYCSELLDVNLTNDFTDDSYPNQWQPEAEIKVNWDRGNKIEFGEYAGVEISFCITETSDGKKYNFNYTNNNDFPVYISNRDFYLNGNIYEEGVTTGWMEMLNAGETWTNTSTYELEGMDDLVVQSAMGFGATELLKAVEKIEKISFTLDIKHAVKCTTLLKDQKFTININFDTGVVMGEEYSYAHLYNQPKRDVLANEQALYEDETLKITLLGFGGTDESSDDYIQGALKIENFGKTDRYLGVDGCAFGDVFIPMSNVATIPQNSVVYQRIYCSSDDLNDCGIDSANSFKLLFRFMDFLSLKGGGGFSRYFWCDVNLVHKGNPPKFVSSDDVIYNSNGIKMSMLDSGCDYSAYWYIAVENNSDKDMVIEIYDVFAGNVELSTVQAECYITDNKIGAGQKTVMRIFCDKNKISQTKSVSLKFCYMDFAEEKIFSWDKNEIQLKLSN